MRKVYSKFARGFAFSAFALAVVFAFSTINANAQAYSEDFADITTLPAAGWATQNLSTTIGTTGWFQGSTAVFNSQAGGATAYIGANYNNTTGVNTISNWLFTPNRTYKNGDIFKFWTRNPSVTFPDRLQVRLSTNGTSVNAGSSSTSVGDFTTLLLDINPTYTDGTGAYPIVWTEYTITLSGLPTAGASGRIAFRYFVENGGPSGDNSNYIGIDTVSYTPAPAVVNTQHVVDFNGDGKTDASVVRNTGGGASGQVTWFNCATGTAEPGCFTSQQWGIASDFFVPVDYDGDGKTDISVWRPGTLGYWYTFNSATSTVSQTQFGQTGDDPTVVGDYTGDGKADLAVYRAGLSAGNPSFWYYLASSGPYVGQITYNQWGINGDFPAPGDYDGDHKSDFMVQRSSGSGTAIFWLLTNTTVNVSATEFGLPTDVIVPGDYDGDGKTDIATVRANSGAISWFVRKSSSPTASPYYANFGLSASDFVVQGDYDGDGKTDVAIWRPNADTASNYFWVLNSSNGSVTNKEWGQNGDFPVANYNRH